MAYKEMKEGGIHATSGYEYFCDDRSDIASLPTDSFGAFAYVIRDGSVWILNSGGTWTELHAGSGGGSGGGGGDSGQSKFSEFTITFNLDGGVNELENPMVYISDAYISYPDNLDADRYSVSNLYTDENLTVTLLAYNGEAYFRGLAFDDDNSSFEAVGDPTIEGALTYDNEEGVFVLTGDATISVTLETIK